MVSEPALDTSPLAAVPAAPIYSPHPSFPTETQLPLGSDGRRSIEETDLRVYPLSLGVGGFSSCSDEDDRYGILDRFIELGGNVIDTAAARETSQGEELVGEWMQKRGNRDRVVVSTSIGRRQGHDGLAPRTIVAAVEASLSNLKVDHLDILFFDGDDVTVPIDDSLAAADELIACGKVRYLAASGYSASRLMEARILSAHGFAKFIGIRTPYSLLERRGFEGNLALVAQAQHLAVVPSTPLAACFLPGDNRARRMLTSAMPHSSPARRVGHRGARVRVVLDEIAEHHGFSVASIALAWLLAKPSVLMPTMSVRNSDHLASLMAAPHIRLTRGHILDLDRVSS